MRTTLDIDADVLAAAKVLARRQKKTAGAVISELARKGIHQPHSKTAEKIQNGFEISPADGRLVTSERVQKIFEASVDV